MLPAPDPSEYGGMSGRLGRLPALAPPAVAVGLAVVLLAGLVVAAFRPGTASAATVLLRGAGVAVELPGGERAPLAEGDEVPRGAVVTAGRSGAVLRTRDRDTWLSGGAVLQVLDGARQGLREGFVMVDARRGPGLELTTSAAVVTAPRGSVARVERGALLRVGSYTGDAVRVRAVERRARVDVDAAYQVQVADGGLPGRTTPLVLTPGDAYERALAADLVMTDEALTDLGRRLDTGRPERVVRAAVATDLPTVEAPVEGAPASERALAYLLARAVDGSLPERFAQVSGLRSDGGSWGVVAALVGAEVERVSGLLEQLLAPASEAVLAAEEVDLGALVQQLTGTTPPAAPAAPGPVAPPAPAPPDRPQEPEAPEGPEGPEEPPSPLPEPVDAVVEAVVDLLPTDSGALGSTPDAPALPGDPVPTPSPTPGGLLGLLTD
jgi:hypothetical protein